MNDNYIKLEERIESLEEALLAIAPYIVKWSYTLEDFNFKKERSFVSRSEAEKFRIAVTDDLKSDKDKAFIRVSLQYPKGIEIDEV